MMKKQAIGQVVYVERCVLLGKSGQSSYIIYSENWLREVLKTESRFIELLPKIYNIWGEMFDACKVVRVIQKHLRNILKYLYCIK